MSGDNGKEIQEEPQAEPQILEMRIVVEPGKPMMVHFPVLGDKIITYGFLKMAEKTLDTHYAQIEKPKIIPGKGGIMSFARRK